MTANPSAMFEDSTKTKQPSRRRFFFPAMSIAVIMIGAGCGDDGGGTTLEEYFAEINRITQEADGRVQRVADDFPGIFEELEATKAGSPRLIEGYQDFIEGVDALDPPQEATDAHDEFVEANKELQALNRARLDRLNEAQEDSDLESIFGPDEQYEAAVDRQNDACVALREIAEGKGISVPGLANCRES